MIQKAKKKPVEIEFCIYTGLNGDEIEKWSNNKVLSISGISTRYLTIATLEGTMRAEEGDYIIKGIKGEFYPCKPDIFLKSYDIEELFADYIEEQKVNNILTITSHIGNGLGFTSFSIRFLENIILPITSKVLFGNIECKCIDKPSVKNDMGYLFTILTNDPTEYINYKLIKDSKVVITFIPYEN